jgi:hypothetical protein
MVTSNIWSTSPNCLADAVRPLVLLLALWHGANTVGHVHATDGFTGLFDDDIIHVHNNPVNMAPADYTPEAQADFVPRLPGFGAPTSNTFAGCEKDIIRTLLGAVH